MTDSDVEDNYIIVSPARNESRYMRHTLDSVCAQTVLPKVWVIVDDGSSDDTPLILNEYAEKFDWIKIITRDDRGHRSVGPGVISAFYAGLDTINYQNFTFLCKLDLDLDLPHKYFEELMHRCSNNLRIGSCSGKAYMKKGGELLSENISDEMSVGASKFMRVKCFDEIGGFVNAVMWDGIDCHLARMKGWQVISWDDPNLNFVHLRPMGSSDRGIIKGRIRHGRGQHFMGGSLLYSFAAAIYRIPHPPIIVGGLMSFWGHLYSMVTGAPQYDNPEFRRFLRNFQRRALFMGKKRATKLVEEEKKRYWEDQHQTT